MRLFFVELDTGDQKIGISALSRLRSLRELHLSASVFPPALVARLARLRQLRQLWLKGLTPVQRKRLQRALPHTGVF